jgi:Uma2 family endonuclease
MAYTAADIGKEPGPLRWTNERFLALVESGVIAEGRPIELIDGKVLETMPQGKLHNMLFLALQRAFAGYDFRPRLMAVQTTLNLPRDTVVDPEFALLTAAYDLANLPNPGDVEWVVEVSVTSRHIDHGPKKAAYAAAGIPIYWIVDAQDRGIWVFTQPEEGEYRDQQFFPAGSELEVPVIGAMLATAEVFRWE